jgi:hypothetical protein
MPSLSDQLASQLADPAFDSAELLSPGQLTDAERHKIPSWWREAALLDSADAMEVAAAQWNSVLPGRFASSLELFRARSAGLHLARLRADDNTMVLIYALHSGSDDADADPFVGWYGDPPKDQMASRRIDVERLPEGVRQIYTRLHVSFQLAGFGSTGFIQSDEMFALDGDADDFEYETDSDRRPDPTSLVPLLLSARGHLCVELTTDADDDQATGWLAYDSTLEDVGPLWPALDERIAEFCSPFD